MLNSLLHPKTSEERIVRTQIISFILLPILCMIILAFVWAFS